MEAYPMTDTLLIDNLPIDGTFKGMPGVPEPFPLGRIREKWWNVLRGDLPLPVALLKQAALTHNGEWMRRFVQATGARLAPHGKTTMCPQLFQRQLRDGAWAITLATVSQVQVARRFGVSRILMAKASRRLKCKSHFHAHGCAPAREGLVKNWASLDFHGTAKD
jgi:D-serine dehydratase